MTDTYDDHLDYLRQEEIRKQLPQEQKQEGPEGDS